MYTFKDASVYFLIINCILSCSRVYTFLKLMPIIRAKKYTFQNMQIQAYIAE